MTLSLRAAPLILALTACNGSDKGADTGSDTAPTDTDTDTTASVPTVLSTSPAAGSVDVPVNTGATATFSEPMDPASLTGTTLQVTAGDPPTPVAGTVITSGATATFWPAAHLASDSTVTVTISTGASSALGVPLEAEHQWTFVTGDRTAPTQPVDLGTAENFAILAKSGISTVPTSAITGDIGVSPAAATYITGFSLTADATDTFSTSPQVTGRVYAADDADPTPSTMTTAVGDMERAFTDAAGRAPDVTELAAGDVSGLTIEPGVYKWGTGLLITSDVTLSGSATDVWIFQIAQDLTVETGAAVVLAGGALPQNVFWQVAGLADLGTGAHLEGVLLTSTSVRLGTGASVDGRLLAQTAVDIDASTIVEP